MMRSQVAEKAGDGNKSERERKLQEELSLLATTSKSQVEELR